MIVLDASALLEQLLCTSKGLQLQERCLHQRETLHCPHLLDIEVTHVLRRYCQHGELSAARAFQAIEDLADFPLTRYAHNLFLYRIWDLRQNLTSYDATYVALAELLGAPLVTCDARLASAPGHKAMIELF
ncbi:type II toxin-antitoxin system VapC family toxin [Nitrospira sp. M1]